MSRLARLYIVEDEVDLAESYAEYLASLGYDVKVAHSGTQLDRLIDMAGVPDLLLLDLNLPGEPGTAILSRIAMRGAFPVVVASADADPLERIVSLELGADDFLVKPVHLREMAARINTVLARYGASARMVVQFESVSVDMTSQTILRHSETVDRLGPGEVALLRTFLEQPNVVLSRQFLIERAPADDAEAFDRAIDNRVSRLRRKLETSTIRTVRSHGYVYEPFVASAETAGDVSNG